jgi:hypothetical protein
MQKNYKVIADKYNKIECLGEGGYGRITKCSLVNSEKNEENKFYALKKYFINRVI